MLAGIEEIENVWITLSDGCRIAARIWRPSDAMAAPVPAILEYIPYRKRDFMRARDEPIHRYFALKGYASVRVDIRGSGDSDGLLEDEYTEQEHRDALEIIAWLAAQPWCSGKVGMMGISWGGFNALQVAALRPPALKAIITLCSTDDRYADDAHYMGGCLLNENLQWGSILTLYGALPPDPEIVGERWREMWRQRIDALEAFPALWMRHPWRDDYWRHGSVCEDYAAIRCAVYAIGGWADGYSNAVPRLLANLNCPKKGLIGPWAHVFPHNGAPGPAIGFLQEAVRWWDRWLKDTDNGIMAEPVYRAWMQEWVPPRPTYDIRPGRWVAEASWPSPRVRRRRLHLNPGTLEPSPAPSRVLSFRSPQTTGLGSGEWCAFGSEGEMATDQRPDDGGSLIFDSDPLTERLEILGAPTIELELAADRPAALVAARLSDVAPEGSALRVSYALLNLCHRDGHARPTALVPGRWYRVRLRLNDIAHAFRPGHRLRLALSTSYWPMAWPSPEPAVLSLRTGAGRIDLPERPLQAEDDALRPFEAPEAAPATTRRTRPPLRRLIETDLGSNVTTYTVQSADAETEAPRLARIEAIDLDLGYRFAKRHRIKESEPLSALSEFSQTARLQRGDWSVRIECRGRVSASLQAFEFTGELEAFEGDSRFARREWRLSIPRQLL